MGRIGASAAALVMPYVLAWKTDMDKSDAATTAPSLSAVFNQAKTDFRRLHPEASGRAVDALAWSYTYDNK